MPYYYKEAIKYIFDSDFTERRFYKIDKTIITGSNVFFTFRNVIEAFFKRYSGFVLEFRALMLFQNNTNKITVVTFHTDRYLFLLRQYAASRRK